MAGGVAHDFNNILMAITGNAELMKTDIDGCPELMEYVDNILTAGARAASVIEQILVFSRRNEGNKTAVRMENIINEAVVLLRSSLPPTIRIRRELGTNNGFARGNPTQMHQVVVNLCTNAAKAMKDETGTIDIRLERVEIDSETKIRGPGKSIIPPELGPGSYLCMTVTDDGCGMKPDVLKRIFEPYFTTADVGKGSGLGLAVIYGIISNHGGAIVARSTPGGGSTFAVYLPVMRGSRDGDSAPSKSIPTGNERVLVVDDEKSITNIMQKLLTDLGYTVSAYNDGIGALEHYRREADNIDLIISDLTMPDMNGAVLVSNMLRIKPEVPVVLISGHGHKDLKRNALQLGARGFVTKPVSKAQLATSVREALDSSSSMVN